MLPIQHRIDGGGRIGDAVRAFPGKPVKSVVNALKLDTSPGCQPLLDGLTNQRGDPRSFLTRRDHKLLMEGRG